MTRHIILIGFMGTGKTTVGQSIARRLGWVQTDIDHEITDRIQKEIREYFAEEGEAAFRVLETEVLGEVLLASTPQVITTGGGIVTRKENKELILQGGLSIALTAKPETIIERLQADSSRPLLQGNLEENTRKLMAERKGLYDFAEIQIATDHRSVEQIVDELWAHPAFRQAILA